MANLPFRLDSNSPTLLKRLTAAGLAAAEPRLQKPMIGEKLYPLIAKGYPKEVEYIVGVLLLEDNPSLLDLLDCPKDLQEACDSIMQSFARWHSSGMFPPGGIIAQWGEGTHTTPRAKKGGHTIPQKTISAHCPDGDTLRDVDGADDKPQKTSRKQ